MTEWRKSLEIENQHLNDRPKDGRTVGPQDRKNENERKWIKIDKTSYWLSQRKNEKKESR